MSIRIVAVWMLSLIGRTCSVKRCSPVKVLTIAFSVILTWAVLVLIDISGIMPGHSSVVNPNDDEGAFVLTEREWIANEQSLVGDYLVQDNPLGTYFSDKLPGNAPLGSSFYASKVDHRIPLKMVLVFVEDSKSALVSELGQFLALQRIEYRTSLLREDIPALVLTDIDVPRYALLVFDDYLSYMSLDPAKRSLIDDYCKKYSVGILAITHSAGASRTKTFTDHKIKLQQGMRLKSFIFNPEIDFWRVVRAEATFEDILPSSDWTIFITEHATYKPLVFSTTQNSWLRSDEKENNAPKVIAVYDEMLNSQNRIRTLIPNFRYFLGFSGGMYMNGTEAEKAGDKRIVELGKDFVWFNHMFRHEQPHAMNYTSLKASIQKNVQFAATHGMEVIREYMVTPHHSGIYPVIESLYDYWTESKVLCTSTDMYPRNLPQWARRGFIHRGIMVVPRQTCRLFTRTIKYENYPGGKAELDRSIFGGYLFKVFLTTPFMIFMTHMSNYANDRLAIYAFDNVLQFVSNWTNLRLLALPPVEMARRYFQMYTQEINAVWTNPCDYDKHREIWPMSKSCTKLPSFIIVGPQKTGTTALLRFLQAHPMLLGSKPDPVHFEEIQFFLTKNYQNGLDWYQDHFPKPSHPRQILFEKSANYFDNELTPKRMYALLPQVKIVILLCEPAKRAYSWYHNMLFHNDTVAMNYTFFEIVSAPDSSPKFLKDVRNRCLRPGMYAVHLSRWLQYFPKEQILLIDSDRLDNDPVTVLRDLQMFVDVEPVIDYSTILEFNVDKGYFCLKESGCLSSNKGRKYAPMDPVSRSFLTSYYRDHNLNLKTLLNNIGHPFPTWLEKIEES
ncbi:bifunctional heparan sulfate N-deacetylase/N-sulfotransferase 3-like isoform X3 [Biomphalaria glabrata]|uniref:[heparan sulfate]-glucosamine N-sulfotransferase n=1 Tax=Biomphalaria glabrata TaxID=6526 RepID=A0A9W2YK95_BIOGL|nr:bifunctional heparan sulfate N-deacetylase/N-sulfotransferase 3-like isoform X3 [Biomphalaria glabrata]